MKKTTRKLPHYENVEAATYRYEPVYLNLFEVEFMFKKRTSALLNEQVNRVFVNDDGDLRVDFSLNVIEGEIQPLKLLHELFILDQSKKGAKLKIKVALFDKKGNIFKIEKFTKCSIISLITPGVLDYNSGDIMHLEATFSFKNVKNIY